MHDDIRRRYDIDHDRVRDTGANGTGDYAKQLMNSLEQAKRLRLRTRSGHKK